MRRRCVRRLLLRLFHLSSPAASPLCAQAQHGGHLRKVNHERALRHCSRLAGGHAGEDAVAQADAGQGGRHERAHVGQEGDEGHLQGPEHTCLGPVVQATISQADSQTGSARRAAGQACGERRTCSLLPRIQLNLC